MRFRKFVFKKISSTNDKSIELIKKGLKNGVILTDHQTKGRGRYGRNWVSLRGNLFMSVFYMIEKKLNLKKLTKFNCKIIASVLKKNTKLNITIKSPNDLLYNQKKICGILQEIINYKSKLFIIVGIGVNVVDSPSLFKYKTTYLNKYLNKKVNKNFIFNKIKKKFETSLGFKKNVSNR